MKALIVDTASGLKAIYIDQSKNIIEIIESKEKKLSEVFHTILDELIQKNLGSWDKLDYYVYNLGPGSYTGLKISNGLAKTLKLNKIKTVGFHSFKIPALLGTEEGYWIDNAFKNEFFIYEWNKDESRYSLQKEGELSLTKNTNYFFKDDSCRLNLEAKNSSFLFLENIEKLMPLFINNPEKDETVFYYRTVDQEYKKK